MDDRGLRRTVLGNQRASARPPATTFEWHDLTLQQDLTAPHAVRLTALECAGQAPVPNRAGRAQRLGSLEVLGPLGKPEIGVVHVARQVARRASADAIRAGGHESTVISRWTSGKVQSDGTFVDQ